MKEIIPFEIYPTMRRTSGSARAFTLIELLVVISIISLLAAIIFVSLNTVRAKARDAKRLIDKEEIIKALYLAYEANQDWPMSPYDGQGLACLGFSDTEHCLRIFGSASLNNALAPYLPIIPRPDMDPPRAYVYGSDIAGWTDMQGAHPSGAYLIWTQEVDMPDAECPPLYRYGPPNDIIWWCYQFLGP